MNVKILNPDNNEAYDSYIHRILESRPNVKDVNEYQEKHHIKPRCMKGTDDKENLIYLYAQEHYYAHKMLALENPDAPELQYAWWMIAHIGNVEVSADEYALARNNFSKAISSAHTGEKNPMYGKPTTEDQKRIVSEICKSRVGNKNPNFGKHLTEEHKKKIADTIKNKYSGKNSHMFGRKLSEETKAKIGEKHKGKNNHKSKEVICIETKKVYPCIRKAAEELRIPYGGTHISGCCRGERKTCAGYHWQYYEDYLKEREILNEG